MAFACSMHQSSPSTKRRDSAGKLKEKGRGWNRESRGRRVVKKGEVSEWETQKKGDAANKII